MAVTSTNNNGFSWINFLCYVVLPVAMLWFLISHPLIAVCLGLVVFVYWFRFDKNQKKK